MNRYLHTLSLHNLPLTSPQITFLVKCNHIRMSPIPQFSAHPDGQNPSTPLSSFQPRDSQFSNPKQPPRPIKHFSNSNSPAHTRYSNAQGQRSATPSDVHPSRSPSSAMQLYLSKSNPANQAYSTQGVCGDSAMGRGSGPQGSFQVSPPSGPTCKSGTPSSRGRQIRGGIVSSGKSARPTAKEAGMPEPPNYLRGKEEKVATCRNYSPSPIPIPKHTTYHPSTHESKREDPVSRGSQHIRLSNRYFNKRPIEDLESGIGAHSTQFQHTNDNGGPMDQHSTRDLRLTQQAGYGDNGFETGRQSSSNRLASGCVLLFWILHMTAAVGFLLAANHPSSITDPLAMP